MKIAFLGDSITEGVHGYSYIKVLNELDSSLELTNYGKGGDTIFSLHKRMKEIEHLDDYDVIVLFIGINDVLGKLSWFYRLLKRLDKQPVAKSTDAFKEDYRATIKYLNALNSKLVIIPPLLIGEDINNKWNKEVTNLVKLIKSILKSYKKVDYLPIRKQFTDYLKNKELSDYLPLKAMDMKQDGDEIRKGKNVDEISKKRGLHLTIDGVHINTFSATMIAKSIQKYLNEYK